MGHLGIVDSVMHPGRIEFHKVPWPGDRRGMWSLWCTGLLTRFLMRLSGGHGIFHKSWAPPTQLLWLVFGWESTTQGILGELIMKEVKVVLFLCAILVFLFGPLVVASLFFWGPKFLQNTKNKNKREIFYCNILFLLKKSPNFGIKKN
jgi:hypothetical protein